jgi:hypothetical protein
MKSTSLKFGLLFLFTSLVYCQLSAATAASNGCDGAGNCYVRAGAAGSGSGADWTNAYNGFGSAAGQINPSSMARGVTYYVAGGTYCASGCTFNTPDSGTSLIMIQAATAISHGTAVGWSGSYVAQARFNAPVRFYTDYWTFTGAYRANTSSPWADWRNESGYGFAVSNNNGSNCPNTNGGAAVQVGQFNNNVPANNVTLDYLDVIGAGDFAQACGGNLDTGLDVNGYTSITQSFYLGHSYVHDTAADNVLIDGVNGATLEYDYIDRSSEGSGTNHMEEVAIRNNTDNLIFRYNFIGACGDTACWATPNAVGSRSNWYVYGNILFINTSETPVTYSSGDGAFSIFSLTALSNSVFANNTISSLSNAGPCGFFPWNPVITSNVTIENNLWFNCPQNNGPAINVGITWDYQAYYESSSMCANDTASHTTCSSTNPFVNVAQSPGANNFNLTAHTSAGMALSTSLPPGCTPGVNCLDTDMNGNSRSAGGNWDRGALQLSNGSLAPAAPTGLAAIVN